VKKKLSILLVLCLNITAFAQNSKEDKVLECKLQETINVFRGVVGVYVKTRVNGHLWC
jgi:hypothetical protein